MWYLLKDNQCYGTISGEPNHEDLATRNEKAVESDLILPISEVGLDDHGNIIQITPPEPSPEELKAQALAALDAEYDPQFEALTLAWATAFMDGDIQIADERLADKQALQQEYEEKREVILNG